MNPNEQKPGQQDQDQTRIPKRRRLPGAPDEVKGTLAVIRSKFWTVLAACGSTPRRSRINDRLGRSFGSRLHAGG
jgi:hypothetical protein